MTLTDCPYCGTGLTSDADSVFCPTCLRYDVPLECFALHNIFCTDEDKTVELLGVGNYAVLPTPEQIAFVANMVCTHKGFADTWASLLNGITKRNDEFTKGDF